MKPLMHLVYITLYSKLLGCPSGFGKNLGIKTKKKSSTKHGGRNKGGKGLGSAATVDPLAKRNLRLQNNQPLTSNKNITKNTKQNKNSSNFTAATATATTASDNEKTKAKPLPLPPPCPSLSCLHDVVVRGQQHVVLAGAHFLPLDILPGRGRALVRDHQGRRSPLGELVDPVGQRGQGHDNQERAVVVLHLRVRYSMGEERRGNRQGALLLSSLSGSGGGRK